MTRRTLPSDPLVLLREVGDVTPPEGAAARIAARLALGAGAGSAVAAASGDSAWQVFAERFVRWSVAPLGVGIALGMGGQALVDRARHLAPPLPSAAASVSTIPALELLEVAPLPQPSTVDEKPTPKNSASTLVEERTLLDKARRQLASDEPALALGFLEQHAQRFARGALVEEREAMWINVLVRLGRNDEAKARGEQFQARFPKSLMGASVRAALTAAGTAK